MGVWIMQLRQAVFIDFFAGDARVFGGEAEIGDGRRLILVHADGEQVQGRLALRRVDVLDEQARPLAGGCLDLARAVARRDRDRIEARLERDLDLRAVAGAGRHRRHARALAADRDPFPNAAQLANYTCVGILAHESAMAGGEKIALPEFTLQSE